MATPGSLATAFCSASVRYAVSSQISRSGSGLMPSSSSSGSAGWPPIVTIARWAVGYVALGQGEVETAETELRAALSVGEESSVVDLILPPLWGLAETAPYLHDGRAGTIPEAILAHGGEATKARDAFAALAPKEQASLHVFLLSLTRTPRARVAP